MAQVVIDHVVVNVRDGLDAAQARWTALGFRLTPRGHHSLGSSNHLAMFGQDYLELLGVEPGRGVSRREMIDHPAGLTGLALKPDGPDFRDVLAGAGVAMGEAREFHRPVTLEDGTSPDARFRTAEVTDARVRNGRVFFCHHYTPGLVWRPDWQDHPNGALALTEVVFRSADPATLAEVFRGLGGDPEPVPGGFAVPAGPARISLLTPDAVSAWLGGAVAGEPGERMVALGLRVRDLASAAAMAGVAAADGVAVVPHGAASGVALVYTAG